MKNSEIKTSQKSPTTLCINPRKTPRYSYQHMFLEDFCQDFSIDLAKDKEKRLFYKVSPENADIKKILSFENPDFLKYDMDDVLSHIMRTLVFAGKSFVEVVSLEDNENNIVGISLKPFDPIFSIPGLVNRYFISIQCNGKFRFYKIHKRNLVILRLSKLGFKTYYLKRLYRRLSRLDVLSAGDMSLSQQNTGFQFTVWNNMRMYKLLKVTKKIGWYGRSNDNYYMGEAYLLYRTIQFKNLRKKFLEYFLEQINQSISAVCENSEIDGILVAESVCYDYDELLQKLSSGEMNYSQLTECVFKNKDITIK